MTSGFCAAVPLTYVDASEATEHFTQVFTERYNYIYRPTGLAELSCMLRSLRVFFCCNRYGPQQPLFFVGGLEEAIENAQSFTPVCHCVIILVYDNTLYSVRLTLWLLYYAEKTCCHLHTQ